MKIEIELIDSEGYKVSCENKCSSFLSQDEMLRLVASLTFSENPLCLSWMKTKEEHEVWRNSLSDIITNLEFENK